MGRKRVAIIGAGLGGITAAIKLQEAGFSDIQMFDRNDRVGGTWAENTYPGCQCDVPVALYQLSFAQSVNWTRLFPSSPEIQAYAEEIVDRYQLRPKIRLSDPVRSAVWSDESKTWTVTTESGHTMEADAVIGALGQLNRPKWPEIQGRDRFAGASMHSARWDHSVDFEGKRVGVIGCAASAVQLIPELAKVAGHLTVFQRSANWLLPRNDRAVPPEELALMMTEPETAMALGAANRKMIYDTADHYFWQAFSWTPEGRAAYTRLATDHLDAQVSDPDLKAKLTPDYPIGCRRILYCDDYYPCLKEDHVSLVTDGIERIVPEGVVTADGATHDFDIIVYATGFETTEWKWSLDMVGQDGLHLNDAWSPTPEAYLGITVSGFPNLFVLYGPNTNLGHNSITFMLERQVEYAVKALQALEAKDARAMAPSRAAQERFNAELQADLDKTVWADPACNSWYKTADGKITQNWSGHTRAFEAAVAEVNLDDYVIL
ncbi:MAG: NAD(P)/FAD-dependent oxidoreductase [Pseudomonadota bacterium]